MKKRLERDTNMAVVAGVLSGMANYFDQDPVLFRLFALVFLILTGIFPGLFMYCAAWIIMPEQKLPAVDYEL